jgi:hypothetical protein
MKIGHSFASPILFFGVVFSIFGFFLCFNEPIIGVIIFVSSSFLWSSTYGIEIDLTSNKIREYSSAYGFKKGKWHSLEKLPYMTFLKMREGMTVYSRSNRSTTLIDDNFGVYLLTNSHRTKILINKFDDENEANEFFKKNSN